MSLPIQFVVRANERELDCIDVERFIDGAYVSGYVDTAISLKAPRKSVVAEKGIERILGKYHQALFETPL